MLDLFDILFSKTLGGEGGGSAALVNKSIAANGTYHALSDGADGYKKVTVAVPVPTLESKSVSANGTYTPESGKAWNEVVVNLPNGIRDWRVYTGTCTTTSVTKSFTFDTGITGTSRLITTIGFCQQDVSELPLASTASSNAYADQICGWACAYGLTAANILVNGYSCGSTWSGVVFRRKDDGTNDYYQSGTSISINASTGKVTVSNSKSDTAFMPGITFDWMIVVGVSS